MNYFIKIEDLSSHIKKRQSPIPNVIYSRQVLYFSDATGTGPEILCNKYKQKIVHK